MESGDGGVSSYGAGTVVAPTLASGGVLVACDLVDCFAVGSFFILVGRLTVVLLGVAGLAAGPVGARFCGVFGVFGEAFTGVLAGVLGGATLD